METAAFGVVGYEADGSADAWVVEANKANAQANMGGEILRLLDLNILDFA